MINEQAYIVLHYANVLVFFFFLAIAENFVLAQLKYHFISISNLTYH